MLVLTTWLWTTAASALLLLTVMALQRLFLGPSDGRPRQRSAALRGVAEPVHHEVHHEVHQAQAV